MKKTIISILLSVLCAAPLFAQQPDTRQRDVTTIVQDALAQMPAKTAADLNKEMADLAKAAPESVTMLAGMLQEAEKGANSLVEYALSGLAAYATDPANSDCLASVKAGFEAAAASATDTYNKQFIQSQLRLLADLDPVTDFVVASDQAISAAQLIKIFKTGDRRERNMALERVVADEKTVKKLVAKYPTFSLEAKADVINWIANLKEASQVDFLIAQTGNGSVAAEAIAALGKIGGEKAAAALVSILGTEKSNAAMKALKSINVELNDLVATALETAEGVRADELLNLAAYRHMKNTAPKFFEMVAAGNAAAKNGLHAVVGPEDAAKVAELLENAAPADVKNYQKALAATLAYSTPEVMFATVKALYDASKAPELYYPAFAACGTDEAVKVLGDDYAAGKAAAFEGLMTIDNYNAYFPLNYVATNNAELCDRAVMRIAALAERHEKDIDIKAYRFIQCLELAKTDNTRCKLLAILSKAPTMRAFREGGKYLDNAQTEYAAALCVKAIAATTTDDIDYDDYQAILGKARAVFASRYGADDGYAVDEINLMLSKARPTVIIPLSEEERAQGFESLFDGTSLDNWLGDKVGYTIVNGNIFVSANYGNSSNLYTKDEYRDFIFRFEFCFDREGVNNGVGIRTPMGVDAAYWGMCEVQILDHDAPIYANLREYQVHGSVYGVVPATRVVHKPLGEWNCEEIEVRGDRVKVTLNGVVILDANVREACQGHNVAPDGGNKNPYTVDHRNHPGMFNERGHVGFLGHGAGIRFRNVRILNLEKSAAKAKTKKK